MDFIDIVESYVSSISDADPQYSRIMTAQMLGYVLGKKSFVNINPNMERLNFYVLLVGESYYGRKTVTQDIFKELYPEEAFLPTETSPERFIANLANKPDGVWFNGEFSKILKHMNTGGYLSSIAEVLNDTYKYEGKVYSRQTMKEKFEVTDIYPSFCSTLTPEVLMNNVNGEMMDGGLFGRMLLVEGKSKNGERKFVEKGIVDIKKNIQKTMSLLYNMEPEVEFRFTEDALEKLNEIEGDMASVKEVRSIAGRYCQIMIKLSAILSVADYLVKNSSNSKNNMNSLNSKIEDDYFGSINNINYFATKKVMYIEKKHLEKALFYVLPCVQFSKSLKEFVSMNKKHIVRVKNYVKDNYPVSRPTVARMCNLDKRQLDEAEETLLDHEYINIVRFRRKRKNGVLGRQQKVYCLAKSKKECERCEYREECKYKV